jgi:hypothetical protein
MSTTVEKGWREYREELAVRHNASDAPIRVAFERGAEGKGLLRPVQGGSPESLAWDAGRRWARAKMKADAAMTDETKEPPRRSSLPQCPLCLKAYRCEGCRKAHQECECKNGNLFADHPAA